MTQPNEMLLQAVLPAQPETVYAALTDAAALRVWLAEHAEVELPDRYEFWGRHTPTAPSRTSASCTPASAPCGSAGPSTAWPARCRSTLPRTRTARCSR